MAGTKKNVEQSNEVKELRNEDPITGTAGAHPVGSGVGAALGGAATGAVAGLVAGPVGTVVGAVVGGVAGGLAGKAVAENVDPTVETAYWRDEYENRPYYNDEFGYDEYEPAYRAGWESYEADRPTTWGEQEKIARQRWESEGGSTTMTWNHARPAAEDAYNRIHTRSVKKAK